MARWRAIAGVVSALVVSVLAASPAAAAQDIEVSTDGRTFVASSSLPLLDPSVRLVPGSSVAKTAWVRNTAPTAGRLRIDLTRIRADDAAFARAVTISVHVGGRTGRVTVADADAAGGCYVISDGTVLGSGATTPVRLTASVSPALGDDGDGRAGTDATVSFDVRARLADAAVPAPEHPSCTEVVVPSTPEARPLPATGAEPLPLPLPLALGIGAVLVGGAWMSRRRRHVD